MRKRGTECLISKLKVVGITLNKKDDKAVPRSMREKLLCIRSYSFVCMRIHTNYCNRENFLRSQLARKA